MARRSIIVIGASAGGIDALERLVETLPANFPAALFVVVHIPTDSPSMLPQILSKNSNLSVKSAQDGEPIRTGCIYVAPVNQHLLIRGDFIELSRGPKENRHRPAIDPLFRSASRYYGNRTIAIVLSGMLDDGSAGLVPIKRRGGICIVQDPEEAAFPSMPRNAINSVEVDYVIPLRDISALLVKLMNEEVEDQTETPAPHGQEKESAKAMAGTAPTHSGVTGGNLLPLTCPDCGGSLWQRLEGSNVHFQCHVGHAFSPHTLVSGNSEALEEALWMALRIIQERITICKELALVQRSGLNSSAAHFAEEAKEAEARAQILRSVLHGNSLGQSTAQETLREQ